MAKIDTLPKKKGRKISRLVVMNPSKGLDNLGSPLLIDDKEFSDMLNMEYDETGVVRKRSGFTAVGGSLTAAKGLGTLVTEAVDYLVTIDGTSMSYLNSGSWTPLAGASFTAGQEVVFSQARNKVFVWNGVDGGAYWDGTTLSRPGTIPKGKFAVFYQDKHIASGVAGQPNRVYISQLDDSTAFTRSATSLNNSTEVPGATVFTGATANFIDVRKDDGDVITGLMPFQDIVLVFKKSSTYQLEFDGTGQPVITPITNSVGCLSHKSIVAVENDILFLSREGVRRIGNDPGYLSSSGSTIRTHIISIRITPTVQSFNTQYITKANGLYFNNKYILAYPTTTSSVTNCIAYDNRFDAWMLWDTITPNQMVQYIDSNNMPHFYFMNDAGTQMYEVVGGTYNDAGTAINSYVVSKSQSFGNPDITNRFVDCTLIFRTIAGQVSITLYTDNNTQAGSAVIGTNSLDGMGLTTIASRAFGTGTGASSTTINTDVAERVVIGQNSRTLKFKISNSRLNENFTFLGYTIGYYPYTHYLFDSQYKIYT
jgi:hypothetical protein